ncbi:hypothetical protein CAF53_19700 [Sphingobium sp. LB126]|nr:hypothetical protein CAF53_19700 [Sphingobium sp. LB126]
MNGAGGHGDPAGHAALGFFATKEGNENAYFRSTRMLLDDIDHLRIIILFDLRWIVYVVDCWRKRDKLKAMNVELPDRGAFPRISYKHIMRIEYLV